MPPRIRTTVKKVFAALDDDAARSEILPEEYFDMLVNTVGRNFHNLSERWSAIERSCMQQQAEALNRRRGKERRS